MNPKQDEYEENSHVVKQCIICRRTTICIIVDFSLETGKRKKKLWQSEVSGTSINC